MKLKSPVIDGAFYLNCDLLDYLMDYSLPSAIITIHTSEIRKNKEINTGYFLRDLALTWVEVSHKSYGRHCGTLPSKKWDIHGNQWFG
jgi:hypothetical protein